MSTGCMVVPPQGWRDVVVILHLAKTQSREANL